MALYSVWDMDVTPMGPRMGRMVGGAFGTIKEARDLRNKLLAEFAQQHNITLAQAKQENDFLFVFKMAEVG